MELNMKKRGKYVNKKSSQLIKQWALSVTKVNRKEREKQANKSEEKRMVQSSILAFIEQFDSQFCALSNWIWKKWDIQKKEF